MSFFGAASRARASRTGSTTAGRGGAGLSVQPEEVSHTQGSTTIKLRPMPAQSAKPTDKLACLNEAVRKILGTTASDGDKRELLVQAFGDVGSTAAAQVDTALLPFHNAEESVAPQLQHPTAFVLTDPKFYRNTGNVVNLQANPTADGAPVTLTTTSAEHHQTARVLLPLAGDQCDRIVRGVGVVNNRIKDHREAFVKEVEIDNRPTGTAKHAPVRKVEPAVGAAMVRQDPCQEALEKVRMDRAVYSFPTMPQTNSSS